MITTPREIEDALFERGILHIAGVDEAGRGPLAGPVVAAAVILPPGMLIEGVRDSKKISAKAREALAGKIKENAIAYAYGIVSPETIDKINILRAAMLAMRQAVEGLAQKPGIILVDGPHAPEVDIQTQTYVKGDNICHSIAAAAILAKVHRDGLMLELDALNPAYGFARHKGYGTAAHVAAIREHGPCPAHRRSFLKWITE